MATTIYPTVPVEQSEADPWPLDDYPLSVQTDEMFARELDTGFAGEIRSLLHDPETGLAGKGPEEALGGVAEAMPLLGELKDRYLAQAIGPRQRSILGPMIDSRLEQAIDQDPDRAARLYDHARIAIQADRQVAIEQKMDRTREERRVTEIVSRLSETPDDPASRPDLDDYQARAAELTPPDASPEARTQVNRMIRIEHAQADRAWQAARGRAAVAAVDWLGKNPASRLLTMPPALRDGLSPEQTERLDAAAINGGRVATDRDLYEVLDGQAVHEPEAFAAVDLAQYRLSLGDHDYQRLVGFQKAIVEGRSDPTFEWHGLGRTFLDDELRKANFDPDGPKARTARRQLVRLLGAFEAVEGRSPMMADIRSLVGDVLRPLADDPNIVRVAGGDPAGTDGNTQVAQHQEPAEARRGIAPNVEPVPGSPEFRAAHLDAVGDVVHLPDGTTIPDENSPTGYVMAPDTDLAKVAAAGRIAGERFASALSDPNLAAFALPVLAGSLGALVGQGGIYDYQRRGNRITGYTQLLHFRNISNVNVGLAGQQAGLSLDKLLEISGQFARIFSSNFDPKEPYGLPAQNRRYIEIGYEIGRSGAFGPPASLNGKR